MENASKALIIAGSILFAILTISIFYFSFGKAGKLAGEVSEGTDQRVLVAFNSSFEAYNKKVMYGADIVSVINKAVDNNRGYGVEYYTNPSERNSLDYYVNIVFEYNGRTYSLKQDYTKTTSSSVRNLIQKNFIDMTGKSDKDPEYKTNDIYKEEVDAFHQFKFTAFKCESVSYTKKGETSIVDAVGRIKEMKFTQTS